MDFRQLLIFIEIYKAGSIVGAADSVRSAPSVLTHHLRNLEHEVGGPLFERRSRGVEPTDLGRKLFPHALDILRTIRLAKQSLQDAKSEITGSVCVSLAYSAVIGIADLLVERVLSRHPLIRLDIVSSVSGVTFETLSNAGVDLAVIYSPSRDSRLRLTPLLEERSVCIGLPEIVGEADQDLPLSEFLKMKYILPRMSARGRAPTDNAEHQRLIEDHATMFTENVEVAFRFITGGYGCMMGSRLYSDHLKHRGLIARPLIDPEITRTLYLCERRDTPITRAIEAVRAIILETIETAVSTGYWPCSRLTKDGDPG
ncbi:LysR family transcriptional regulator [Solirhodobacter olei]|uniref:LysR family transcriptional regulator n=1 Tax=Solirhodobacter olei TaxID=2493082 RepID=UPI000FD89AEF|nr:LysR family transcriptional regulator [Solirhodobacter olei]